MPTYDLSTLSARIDDIDARLRKVECDLPGGAYEDWEHHNRIDAIERTIAAGLAELAAAIEHATESRIKHGIRLAQLNELTEVGNGAIAALIKCVRELYGQSDVQLPACADLCAAVEKHEQECANGANAGRPSVPTPSDAGRAGGSVPPAVDGPDRG